MFKIIDFQIFAYLSIIYYLDVIFHSGKNITDKIGLNKIIYLNREEGNCAIMFGV